MTFEVLLQRDNWEWQAMQWIRESGASGAAPWFADHFGTIFTRPRNMSDLNFCGLLAVHCEFVGLLAVLLWKFSHDFEVWVFNFGAVQSWGSQIGSAQVRWSA